MRLISAILALVAVFAGACIPRAVQAAQIHTAKALHLCNQGGEEITVAIAWDTDDIDTDSLTDNIVTAAKGWYHIANGSCQTITMPTFIDENVAFHAETRASKHVWNPGFESKNFCTDDASAFELQQNADQTCSSPYVASPYYPPALRDLDYTYADNTWSFTFYRRDFGFDAPKVTTPDGLAFDRGTELFSRGKFAQAIRFFDRAIALNKKSNAYYAFRAQAKFELGKYDSSLDDADAAVRLSKSGLEDFVAENEWALGLFDSAAQDYGKAALARADGHWNDSSIASETLVLRAAGSLKAAHSLLNQCLQKCDRSKEYAAIEYLAGKRSAHALLSGAKTAYERANLSGVIGYDLYLRKQKQSAAAYLRAALQPTRAGYYIVPTPILRAALSAL